MGHPMKILPVLFLILATGCGSLPVRKSPANNLKSPREVVKAVMPRSGSRDECWGIDRIKPLRSHFGGDLGVAIDRLVQERAAFERRFARREVPMGESYLGLSQMDPVTLGTGAPWEVRLQETGRTTTQVEYHVRLRLQGSSRPYRQGLRVTLENEQGGWLITGLRYERDDLEFLGTDPSMRGFLMLVTKQLRESVAWAEKHRRELPLRVDRGAVGGAG
jgi:hypothetical protein